MKSIILQKLKDFKNWLFPIMPSDIQRKYTDAQKGIIRDFYYSGEKEVAKSLAKDLKENINKSDKNEEVK